MKRSILPICFVFCALNSGCGEPVSSDDNNKRCTSCGDAKFLNALPRSADTSIDFGKTSQAALTPSTQGVGQSSQVFAGIQTYTGEMNTALDKVFSLIETTAKQSPVQENDQSIKWLQTEGSATYSFEMTETATNQFEVKLSSTAIDNVQALTGKLTVDDQGNKIAFDYNVSTFIEGQSVQFTLTKEVVDGVSIIKYNFASLVNDSALAKTTTYLQWGDGQQALFHKAASTTSLTADVYVRWSRGLGGRLDAIVTDASQAASGLGQYATTSCWDSAGLVLFDGFAANVSGNLQGSLRGQVDRCGFGEVDGLPSFVGQVDGVDAIAGDGKGWSDVEQDAQSLNENVDVKTPYGQERDWSDEQMSNNGNNGNNSPGTTCENGVCTCTEDCEKSCPADRTSGCEMKCSGAGTSCTFNCPGGNCTFNCEPGTNCQLDCQGNGSCQSSCGAGASCELACSGSSCQQTCTQGVDCNIIACEKDCQLTCGGSQSCDINCGLQQGCVSF